MNRTSTIILLSTILLFSCTFLLFYGKKTNLEGLTLYDSVKAASDSEIALINSLKEAAENPAVLNAIAQLPDGGADLKLKMDAALTSINNALIGATYYTTLS